MDDRPLHERAADALAAFDAKSAANLERAAAMVLVEQDPLTRRWCVRLWHEVRSTPTGERVGVYTLWTFDDDGGGGETPAREMARLLTWWMRQALNLYGKPPAQAKSAAAKPDGGGAD